MEVTHAGLTNYLLWSRGSYAVKGKLGSAVHSSISFDLTVTVLNLPDSGVLGIHSFGMKQVGEQNYKSPSHFV